ncbi:hypothetical protein MPLSOD_20108 [Mesorhizobium sp. SOD10]|nr:hypothetical protein MPLSOD_20108 [Mesorhizobium sp. SOD10]
MAIALTACCQMIEMQLCTENLLKELFNRSVPEAGRIGILGQETLSPFFVDCIALDFET